MPLVTDIKDIIKEMRVLLGLSKEFDRNMSDAGKHLGNASRGMRNKGGKANNGSNNGNGMSDSLGEFTSSGKGGGGKNILSPSMPSGDFLEQFKQITVRRAALKAVANILGTAVAGTAGVIGGARRMMPDTSSVLGYAQGYYGASLATGGVGRANLERVTMRGMSGGLTMVGGDAVTAATFTGMGIQASSRYGSQYQMDVRSVGNAAKYLGMDNATAAQAIGGLTSGATSAGLLRTLGVKTSDWRTGKRLSQGQIMAQIAGRLTAGQKKATLKETMSSLQSGKLGASIEGMALDPAQKEILKKYMLAQSMGFNMDLSSNKSMKKLNAFMKRKGNENPALAQMLSNETTTGTLQAGESSYIAGAKDAAAALYSLKDAANALASTFGGLQGFGQMFKGNPIGQGLSQVGGSILGTGVSVAANVMGYKMLKKAILGGGAAAEAGPVSKLLSGGKGMVSKAGPLLKSAGGLLKNVPGLKSVAAIGAVLSAAEIGGAVTKKNNTHTGADIGRSLGELGGSVGGWALGASLAPETAGLSLLIPIIASLAGSKVTGDIGASIGSMFDHTGGPKSGTDKGARKGRSSKSSSKSKKKSSKAQSNVAMHNPTISTRVSAGGSYVEGQHDGIDYDVAAGSDVFAVLDGTVADIGGSKDDGRGYYIYIDHGTVKGKKVKTGYYHLTPGSNRVTLGMDVKRGQKIAKSGRSGSGITGAHLHFSLWVGGKVTNPTGWVAASGGAGYYANQKDKPAPAMDSKAGVVEQAFAAMGKVAEASAAALANAMGGNVQNSTSTASSSGGNVFTDFFNSIFGGGSKAQDTSGSTPSGGLAAGVSGVTGGNYSVLSMLGAGKGKGPSAEILKRIKAAKGNYIPSARGASQGEDYVVNDGPVNVHRGETILDVNSAREYRQQKVMGSQKSGPQVNITVQIRDASDAEAKKFAQRVKVYLEEDKLMSNMGAY